MTTNTDKLIQDLSRNLQPVQPLSRPGMRAATWLAILLPYVAAVLLMMGARQDLPARMSDTRFLLEQIFAFATGVTAVVAAFASVIPGQRRRFWAWPLLPLAAWLATLGESCVQAGVNAVSLHHDLRCLPYIVLLGTAPAIVLWIMLRRGAPLTPRSTAALGVLAAAGLGNFCVRLGHPEDVTVMLLVWHAGGVIALAAIASVAGRTFLNWRSITGAAQTSGR
jgi:hypothetical protein